MATNHEHIDPDTLRVGDRVIIWITGVPEEFLATVVETHDGSGSGCVPKHDGSWTCHHRGPWLRVEGPEGASWLVLKSGDFILRRRASG